MKKAFIIIVVIIILGVIVFYVVKSNKEKNAQAQTDLQRKIARAQASPVVNQQQEATAQVINENSNTQ